ncbi:MAG TPA: serine hydrolase [Gemmatimonadaceae bacterium]
MTSIGIRHEHGQTTAQPRRSTSALPQALLVAGVLSSLLYVATDLAAAMRYQGYSIVDQAISELSAIGAPTSRLWAAMSPIYGILILAFGVGVFRAARDNRALRVTGALLVAFAVSGVLWLFFPMHQRGTEITWQDAGHLVLSAATVFLILCYIGFGAFALGRRFRVYSLATMLALLVTFAIGFSWAGRVAAGEPTPWFGAVERITVYGYLLWVAVLAVALLRRDGVRELGTTSTGGAPAIASSRPIRIEGHVSPGFEPVRRAFVENFARRHELGGACCVYYEGEKVVDLWGGARDKATGTPWEEDTMVIVWSATKGLSAMTLAVAHSRGLLDYDERVSTYWPEFAQNGKEQITVRQLLAHQAGLFAFDEPVDKNVIADLDRLALVLARQKPAWEPGTRQSYHALTLGFYESELLRRIDPRHRSLGQFFQDEIAAPLGLDFYIRLPESIPNSRLATLAPPSPFAMLLGFPIRMTLAAMNHRSDIYRALITNPGTGICLDPQRIYSRNFEVPSGGGVGTARAIAKAYGVFATGGHELALHSDTLNALAAPPIPSTNGFHDDGLMGDVRFSLGFMKPGSVWRFGGESSFGSPGSGGSLGFADPAAGIGYGYVTSQMGTTLTGDPRDVALRDALYSIIPRARVAAGALAMT